MKSNQGFTFIEIVIVLGILGVMLAIGLPISLEVYRNYLLTAEVRNLLSILRRAENLVFANVGGSNHGVALQSDKFVLFQGPAYTLRLPAYDEEYLRAPSVTVTGFSEIVFAPLSGKPNATATIVFTNGLRSETLDINAEGTIIW